MTSSAETATSRVPAAGWGLTLRIFGTLLVGSAALFAFFGVDEAGVRVWVRATARASAVLFLLAFTARPLRQLWRSDATSWLLRNRRYLGASGALAQLLHGIAILWLLNAWPEPPGERDVTSLVGGGLGFFFYFAMGLTSSDAAVAALGRRGWKALHTVGAYWIWFIFALTNWGNVTYALSGKLGLAHQALYLGLEAALFAALGLRVAARLRGRRAPATT